MQAFWGSDQGYSDYPDERMGLGPIGGFVSMGGLNYTPDLAPVGTQASYWPRDVDQDIDALEYLGFLRDGSSSSMGSQAADMKNGTGAWDPKFRAAITAFQSVAGRYGYTGAVDGWVGPKTRAALLVAVQQKNAGESPVIPPFTPPATPPAPNVPPFTPPSPAPILPAPSTPVTPAALGGKKKDNTTLYVVGGLAALTLVGVGVWALAD